MKLICKLISAFWERWNQSSVMTPKPPPALDLIEWDLLPYEFKVDWYVNTNDVLSKRSLTEVIDFQQEVTRLLREKREILEKYRRGTREGVGL